MSIAALPAGWITPSTVWHINPTGKFFIGGPDGDCGLTGRKIIVDTYGGAAPHGGGAFSGKDPTKVDRSAAYAARYLAKNVVAANLADRCTIQLSYAIGVASPLSIYADLHGTGQIDEAQAREGADGGHESFAARHSGASRLNKPIYARTSAYGHFGRAPDADGGFSWEKTDLATSCAVSPDPVAPEPPEDAGGESPPETRAAGFTGAAAARSCAPDRSACIDEVLPGVEIGPEALAAPAPSFSRRARSGSRSALAPANICSAGEGASATSGSSVASRSSTACAKALAGDRARETRRTCGCGRATRPPCSRPRRTACFSRVFHSLSRPWPKRRHNKRRLISDPMVETLARALKPGGDVRFATDIDDYAGWTLRRFLGSAQFRLAARARRRLAPPLAGLAFDAL